MEMSKDCVLLMGIIPMQLIFMKMNTTLLFRGSKTTKTVVFTEIF